MLSRRQEWRKESAPSAPSRGLDQHRQRLSADPRVLWDVSEGGARFAAAARLRELPIGSR